MNKLSSGFEEREHTADVSLYIWAESIEQLYMEAAKGMVEILKPEFEKGAVEVCQTLSLEGADAETLMVAFLSELIYLLDEQNLVFTDFDLEIRDYRLTAQIKGRKVRSIEKEIKAVTYSDLEIKESQGRFTTMLVFDI